MEKLTQEVVDNDYVRIMRGIAKLFPERKYEIEKVMEHVLTESVFHAKKIRQQALEEAAKACDDLAMYDEYDPGESFAAAIRALK